MKNIYMLIFLTITVQLASRPPLLSIHFLNAGHGDATLIRTPAGKTLMVDCGSRTFGQVHLPRIMHLFRIRQIDALFLSHPHDDHIGGVHALLKNVRIKVLLEPGFACDSSVYCKLLNNCQRNNIPIQFPTAGTSIHVEPGLTIQILSPPAGLFRYTRSDINNNSLVLLLIYKNIRILFPGDAENVALAALFKRYPLLRCDVIKIPHHGSRTAHLPGMYRKLQPSIAIIPCGRNSPWGIPSPLLLYSLKREDVKIYRTDINGTIRIDSNGYTLSVQTNKATHFNE